MTSPNLSQTLQNLEQNFPGSKPGGVAPNQALPDQIVPLLKGGVLPPGAKIARDIDIEASLATATKGLPPSATRKLLTDQEVLAYTDVPAALLNGFTGSVAFKVSATSIAISGALVAPVGAVGNTIVCDLPAIVAIQIAALNDGAGAPKNDQYYVNGNKLYYASGTGSCFLAFTTMRLI